METKCNKAMKDKKKRMKIFFLLEKMKLHLCLQQTKYRNICLFVWLVGLFVCWLVGCMLIVTPICSCVLGTGLLKPVHVLPH